ncbi:phosphotransferase [Bifidobacterium tibiigranuli]|jgi:Ser/Thr protein kinase RdoA (MazF antagonist)|uniref:phosphotransferase n=1 Tax=Bifidobacterium tibiigranuli TaxID=2172043 RepID=UPI0026ECDFCD|nr:phosphotransferase [Bifidobacterium tibiigranuli]MCI2186673.1 phosphotransferase [Bifidobacterium tibiigranuli]MCI2204279.1 phosphotransferase [Bifidobacterium tibiigranuli]
MHDFSGYEMLRVPHDAVSAGEASEFAEYWYGLHDVATRRIATERDDTFAVSLRGEAEPRYILKFEHPAESRDSVLLRAQALTLLQETQPDIPATRLIPARGGELVTRFEQNETVRWTTLTTFLHGVMVSALSGPLPRPLLDDIGFQLAQIQCALSDMSYCDTPGRVLWDMQLLPQIAEDLLPMLHEAESRRRVSQAVDDYMIVAPVVEQLPATLCHGDFHPGNLMIDPDAPQRLSGILDFGDMHMMPPICDLGTCLSYLIDERSYPNDPLMPCRVTLEGYVKGIGYGNGHSFANAWQLDLLPSIVEARGALAVLLPLMTEQFSGVDAGHYLTDLQQRINKLRLVQDLGQLVAERLGIARQRSMLEHSSQHIITQHAS